MRSMKIFKKKKLNYIQQEFKNIFDIESPFSKNLTFNIVKLHYKGEILELKIQNYKKLKENK